MRITTLVPWHGSNRTLAHLVGERLSGCTWVHVPFCGGMCEIGYIEAATILVGDVHRHVINLARVVRDYHKNVLLRDMLSKTAYHPDELAEAQAKCRLVEAAHASDRGCPYSDLEWAHAYFVATWMARNGMAGTRDEFDASYSLRWCDGGGDSAMRFRNATWALADWCTVFQRCTFVLEDVFTSAVNGHDKDEERHGRYWDAPFPGPGDRYKHPFDESKQRRLAELAHILKRSPIVIRYYDHPLIRELYPQDTWHWEYNDGRRQTNEAGPEVLISRRAKRS